MTMRFHNNRPNPRGCPGSYSTVPADDNGYGVCPFCNNDFKLTKAGMVRAHPRPHS